MAYETAFDIHAAIAESEPLAAALLMGAYDVFSARERLFAARDACDDEARQAALDEALERACAFTEIVALAQSERAGEESARRARERLIALGGAAGDGD